jgi:hypothetical protein
MMVDKNKFGKIQRDHTIGLYDKNVAKIDFKKGKQVIDFKTKGLIEAVKISLEKLQ